MEKAHKVRFGTGGIPLSTAKRDTAQGIARLRELGLDHMELEFVYSVYLKDSAYEEVRAATEEHDVSLSVHGSYYTNLASEDKQKWHASITRLVKAAQVGNVVGAKSITFHPAFYGKRESDVVLSQVVEALQKALAELEDTKIMLAPELTGKGSQFGTIEELVQIVKEFGGVNSKTKVRFCIDFAHNHARQNGAFAEEDDFRKFFDYIFAELGEEVGQALHMHMSAIEFSEKGERNHLTFLDSLDAYKAEGIDIPELEEHYKELEQKNRLGGGKQDWQALLRVLKEYEIGGYLVCESPNLEHDALLMQRYYESI